jgi:hypothetical protein
MMTDASTISSSVLQRGAKQKSTVSAVFKIPRIAQQLRTSRRMPSDASAVTLLIQPSEMHRRQVCVTDQSLLALLAKAKPQSKSLIVPTQARKPGALLKYIPFHII